VRSCILRPCPNATSQRALGCDPWPSVGSTEVAALLSQERGLILPRTRHRSCVLNSADSAQRSCALRGLGYAFSPLIPIGDGHDGRSGIGSGVNTWRPDPSSPTLTWRPYPGTAGHPRIGMRRRRLSGQPSPCCVGCSATARPLAARPSGYAQRGCRGESAHQSVVRAPGHRPRCKSGLRRLTPPVSRRSGSARSPTVRSPRPVTVGVSPRGAGKTGRWASRRQGGWATSGPGSLALVPTFARTYAIVRRCLSARLLGRRRS
jgi:hypothetical protein